MPMLFQHTVCVQHLALCMAHEEGQCSPQPQVCSKGDFLKFFGIELNLNL